MQTQEEYISQPMTPAPTAPAPALTQESTPPQLIKQPEQDIDIEDADDGLDFGAFAVRSSTTELPPHRPKGTSDNLMTLADIKKDKGDYLRLEGTPPDRFDRNHERTLRFLTQFK